MQGGAVGAGDSVCSGLTSVGVGAAGDVRVIVEGTLVIIPGFSGT